MTPANRDVVRGSGPMTRARTGWVGLSMTWLSGASLACSLLMILGLLLLLAYEGLGFFWQKDVVAAVRQDGSELWGEPYATESVRVPRRDYPVTDVCSMLVLPDEAGGPDAAAEGVLVEWLRWIYNASGRAAVVEAGLLPASPDQIARGLAMAGMDQAAAATTYRGGGGGRGRLQLAVAASLRDPGRGIAEAFRAAVGAAIATAVVAATAAGTTGGDRLVVLIADGRPAEPPEGALVMALARRPALAVYVARDCPLEHVSFHQLDAVFGAERRRGFPDPFDTWEAFGRVDDGWPDRPVGARVAARIAARFRDAVLAGGGLHDGVVVVEDPLADLADAPDVLAVAPVVEPIPEGLRALRLGADPAGPYHDLEGLSPPRARLQLKVGNRRLETARGGLDFVWVFEEELVRKSLPEDVVVLERLEWGNFIGMPVALQDGETTLAEGPAATMAALHELHEAKLAELERMRRFQDDVIGELDYELQALRGRIQRLRYEIDDPAREAAAVAPLVEEASHVQAAVDERNAELQVMRAAAERETVVMRTSWGATAAQPVAGIVRIIEPNKLTARGRIELYGERVVEFLLDEPRESNTEGGVFPAIFGTILMVFLMTVFVTPFGVIAAVYLREYARQGALVRLVRIAVNNLAGVPSIVFGVFGLGFFVYILGGTIDQLFYPEALPTPTFGTGGIFWAALTLALLTVPVVIVATEEGLAAVPKIVRQGSLALGATKWETTWKVVVPAAAPGILTGVILAIARAAGEVAPLMVVGMVKLAPDIIDGHFPYLHFERKFMHLGFHIYDVGFQSPNAEAVRPLVYATALLLVGLVTVMNLLAIWFRNHLRKKYATSAV